MARDQDAWRGVFVDAINAGTEQGLIRPQRSPELIAMLLVSTCDGTVFPMWMGNQSFDMPAVRAAILEDLARVLEYQPSKSEGEIA